MAVIGLTGYNVYRNGDKLNSSPVTALTFPDGSVPFGLNSYRVTALYGAAESLPAGPVVVNAVPLLRSLNDIVVANGMVKCYNAVQTISVAGNGTTFTVENGGSATMIAGQQIIFYPGTTVQNGGYLWGYIGPAGGCIFYPHHIRKQGRNCEDHQTTPPLVQRFLIIIVVYSLH